MKALQNLRGPLSVASVLCLLCASSSCVNEDYDVSKPIDGTITLLRNVSLPVGDVEKFYLKDLISGMEESSLQTAENGDYFFALSNETFTHQIEVPNYVYEGYSESEPQHKVPSSPVVLESLASGSVSNEVSFEQIEFRLEINRDDIPTEVLGVRYADVTSDLVLRLEFTSKDLPFDRVILASGMTITFPEYAVIGDRLPEGMMRNPGTNEFSTIQTMPVDSSGIEFRFPLDAVDFEKIPEGQGLIEPGKFVLSAAVLLDGNIFVSADDCTETGSWYPQVTGYLSMDYMSIEKVVARIAYDADVEVSPFAIDAELPEFLADENVVLDIEGLRMNLAFENSLPLGGTLSARLNTSADGTSLCELPFGPVRIEKAGQGSVTVSAYSLSENGSGAPEGYEDLAVPGFNDLVNRIPDEVAISDIDLAIDDEYIEIVPGAFHDINVTYGIEVPLAFGPQLNISFEQQIDDLDLSFTDFTLQSAVISLEAENTVPLCFKVLAAATDENGNVLEHIDIDIDNDIKAGSIGSPVTSEIHLTITGKSENISFNGLKLNFIATSPDPEYNGIPLNSGQGLKINDLVLNLPDGITFEMEM